SASNIAETAGLLSTRCRNAVFPLRFQISSSHIRFDPVYFLLVLRSTITPVGVRHGSRAYQRVLNRATYHTANPAASRYSNQIDRSKFCPSDANGPGAHCTPDRATHRGVKQIAERPGDRAIAELAAAGDGGETAERSVEHESADREGLAVDQRPGERRY